MWVPPGLKAVRLRASFLWRSSAAPDKLPTGGPRNFSRVRSEAVLRQLAGGAEFELQQAVLPAASEGPCACVSSQPQNFLAACVVALVLPLRAPAPSVPL